MHRLKYSDSLFQKIKITYFKMFGTLLCCDLGAQIPLSLTPYFICVIFFTKHLQGALTMQGPN